MSVATIVTGDDTIITAQLLKNGSNFRIDSGANIKASLITKDRRNILIPPVTADSNEVDSDWFNSLIIIKFTSAETDAIPKNKIGGALLEIQVNDGGKLTWFQTVKILQGTIEQTI